jgi:hypothetical protein
MLSALWAFWQPTEPIDIFHPEVWKGFCKENGPLRMYVCSNSPSFDAQGTTFIFSEYYMADV